MIGNATTPILCYVTDRQSLPGATASGDGDSNAALISSIERAASAGADWIQVREKDLEARPLEALVRRAVEAIGGRARILVNDRLDVALAAGADGAHFGETSLPVARVAAWRAAVGRNKFAIGVSCHSAEAVRAAERAGADYVFFGPVFATPSKSSFGLPQGLERLAAACHGARVPVLAIGGITEFNAADCFAAGAAGIAAIRMFQQEGNLAEIVAELHAMRAAGMEKNIRGENSR
ncbi:MAG: thiamine phosphate synthase [Candidatus Acidiferrales bacterium]